MRTGSTDELVSRAFGTPVILGYRYGAAAMAGRYAAIHETPLIELGTRQGNAMLFPRANPPMDQRQYLESLFSREDHTLVFSSFEPEFLSCLCYVDAEQTLKAYFESDHEDSRIASGALSLARAFTQKIDAAIPLHMVVNLRSPLVKRILTLPPDRAQTLANILTANARMFCKDKTLGADGFARSLAELNQEILTLSQYGDIDE